MERTTWAYPHGYRLCGAFDVFTVFNSPVVDICIAPMFLPDDDYDDGDEA